MLVSFSVRANQLITAINTGFQSWEDQNWCNSQINAHKKAAIQLEFGAWSLQWGHCPDRTCNTPLDLFQFGAGGGFTNTLAHTELGWVVLMLKHSRPTLPIICVRTDSWRALGMWLMRAWTGKGIPPCPEAVLGGLWLGHCLWYAYVNGQRRAQTPTQRTGMATRMLITLVWSEHVVKMYCDITLSTIVSVLRHHMSTVVCSETSHIYSCMSVLRITCLQPPHTECAWSPVVSES